MMTDTDSTLEVQLEAALRDNDSLRNQVNDLKASVHRLTDTSKLYRLVADTASDVILSVSEDDEILYANPSTERVLGYRPVELLGESLLKIIPSDYQSRHVVAFQQFLKSGKRTIDWSGIEVVALHKEGFRFPAEVSFGCTFTSDGTYRFTGFLRDIRERKRIEEELRQRIADLAHMNRIQTVGELASGLAHELNQPLSAICLQSDFVREWFSEQKIEGSEQIQETLETIAGQAERAAEIIRLLREMVKKTKPKQVALPINELISSALKLAHPQLAHHRIKVERVDPFGELDVRVDRTQMEQVLLNLIQNAIDAMREVEPQKRLLRIEVNPTKGQAHVLIHVIDSGVGLGDVSIEKIFENFHTSKPNGMGMGLGICRSILESHGGLLKAQPNRHSPGMTMTAILPLKPEAGMAHT